MSERLLLKCEVLEIVDYNDIFRPCCEVLELFVEH